MKVQGLQDKTIAVLFGGGSAEREVSLQSGRTVSDALRGLGYRVCDIDPAESNWMQELDQVAFAFIVLHGPGGEDGTVQGALEVLGIPYTGSRVLGSALAMDKRRSKQLWQGVGIATGGFELLQRDTDWQAVIKRLGKVFVKPACEGSSIGMAPATSALELEQAYLNAAKYSGDVIAEQFIDGPEYTVAVLGSQALPSICMETTNEFYDYEAKYLSDDTTYNCPSGLNAEAEQELSDLALAAFTSLGCEGWGRVDIMRDRDGAFYVLEVNTIPGMTSHSLVPMAAREAGMEVPELVEHILGLAWEGQS